MSHLSRRAFLGGAVGSVVTAAWPARAQQTSGARVASVTHGEAWTGDGWNDADLDAKEIRAAVEQVLSALASTATPSAAVRSLFPAVEDPAQRYAIKVNCVNEHLPSHPTVVRALVELLLDAGARAENIVVFDRTDHELEDCGFPINRGPGLQIAGTNQVGHSDELVALTHGSVRLSKVLADADHVINVPVLKNHEMAGVSLALKNHFGSIDRPDSLHGPDRSCCPGIAELNAVATIRDKTRLVLIDALFATVTSGLAARPDVAPMTLIASTDPVAADAVGQDLINARRNAPIDGRHIREAAAAGLGTADLETLEQVAFELSPAAEKPKPWADTETGCSCGGTRAQVLTTAAAALLARRSRGQ